MWFFRPSGFAGANYRRNRMKKVLYLLLITLLLLVGVSVNAQEVEPEYYTVVKGDTLWDISGDKYNDSFLWPKLWKFNPQVENPDLIYPGDRLLMPSREELMRMLSSDEEVRVLTAPLTAPIIEVPEEKPVKYIVAKDLYITSGWITSKYSPTGEVMSAPHNKTILGEGDLAYIETDEGAMVGDKFYAIRKIKKVKHPKKWKSLGYHIRVVGILEVIGMDGVDNDIPKVVVTTSYEEDIIIGDGLIR
ncbi:MAG TPA: LysM peptidoglycan-binding domain-containing protein, partial [Nitrospirae bacterium]|nr:LysM peptidoglycan-binding domain-containing protein [Nitrospirota bacterium]